MPVRDKSLPDPHSKTKRKNDMLDLQKLGEALLKLSDNQLEKIDLPYTLREAVRVAHTLKAHEAIRRHMQYIGKLMRSIDAEELKIAIKQVQFTNAKK